MKTLFCQAPGRVAVLVIELNGRRRERVKRFKDGCEALRWCEANGAMLVYFPPGSAVELN